MRPQSFFQSLLTDIFFEIWKSTRKLLTTWRSRRRIYTETVYIEGVKRAHPSHELKINPRNLDPWPDRENDREFHGFCLLGRILRAQKTVNRASQKPGGFFLVRTLSG